MIFGAFTAAVLYCLLVFTVLSEYLYNPVGVIVIFFLSVFITFGADSVKELLKTTIIAAIISFALGGFASAMFYFINISDFIGDFVNIYIHNFSLKFLIFSISGFYILIKFITIWYKKITVKKQVFYDVMIFFEDKKIKLKALVDTGNSLYEPISGKPVIISEFNAVKEIIPDNFKEFFENDKNGDGEKIYEYFSFDDFSRRIRIIPFSSLGKRKGAIVGLLTDKAVIYSEKNLCFETPVIGIYNFKLSEKNDYNALLNPKMIENIEYTHRETIKE